MVSLSLLLTVAQQIFIKHTLLFKIIFTLSIITILSSFNDKAL